MRNINRKPNKKEVGKTAIQGEIGQKGEYKK